MKRLIKSSSWLSLKLCWAIVAVMLPLHSFGQGDSLNAQLSPGGVTDEWIQGRQEAPPISDIAEPDVPLDQYKPAIPPDPSEISRSSSGPNLPVMFDPATGTETILDDAEWPAFLEKGWMDGDLGVTPSGKAPAFSNDGIGLMNFNNIEKVTNTTDFPWRANCKLFITFRATDDSLVYLVGSGTLINQKFVLTAGHNVYRHSYALKTINAWAESIKVVPAYNNGSEPYGSASRKTMHSWTSWTNDANYDSDIGLIRLDRPLGLLTGYYGYGYDNCTFMMSHSFGMAGYPAAYPADGKYMANWAGTFGSCSGARATINKSSLYGMDGANCFYNPIGDSYYTYGVASLITLYSTDCTLITSAKFTNIHDWISGSYPATYDLQPITFRCNAEYYAPGDHLSQPTVRVLNYSSAAYDGRVNYTIRLSTDSTISGTDREISGQHFDWDFAPRESIKVNITPPAIPDDTPPGIYYVGVLLSNSDADASNNDSSGQDAMKIYVSPAGAPTALPFMNGFEAGANGWTPVCTIPPFDTAHSTDTEDHLGLCPNGSIACFAFWSSPQYTLVRGKSYRAVFMVKTSEANPDNALSFRVRCNQAASNRSWVANCDSVQGTAPTNTGPKIYALDILPEFNDPTEKVSFSFDMLSFNPFDNLTGWVYLESFILAEYPN